MKHLSTIGSAALLGSMGVVVMNSITGCSGQQQQEPQNRFLVIEQQPGGKYIVVEEMPTEGPSRHGDRTVYERRGDACTR